METYDNGAFAKDRGYALSCDRCHAKTTCNLVDAGSADCKRAYAARSLQTNADRIRSMSDEELAVSLTCPNEMGMADIQCDPSDDKNCCQCLLDWLRQPEEE